MLALCGSVALSGWTSPGLSVFSPGAVVSPGAKLTEIVPTRRAFIVAARLPAADVVCARRGRPADVRLLSDARARRPS
jgi:hypothetical protein